MPCIVRYCNVFMAETIGNDAGQVLVTGARSTVVAAAVLARRPCALCAAPAASAPARQTGGHGYFSDVYAKSIVS